MTQPTDRAVFELERPDSKLWHYYVLGSVLLGPFFFVALVPLYFRYHTLRYRFDQEGISMAWGILFRREIHLTYSRIQDIHLVANVVERWLGLARIQIQTASGSAKAEMTLEGLLQFELVRDFLYGRMRGLRDRADGTAPAAGGLRTLDAASAAAIAPVRSDAGSPSASSAESAELAKVLAEVAAELRSLRLALEHGQKRDPGEANAGGAPENLDHARER
ncbi:MAG TPA: PH domain-containing protein [Thermoanaerobaculia bacterium]|nr:PH domain-containing protein [Thermoanaerobaculia bacterium]